MQGILAGLDSSLFRKFTSSRGFSSFIWLSLLEVSKSLLKDLQAFVFVLVGAVEHAAVFGVQRVPVEVNRRGYIFKQQNFQGSNFLLEGGNH